MATAAGITTVPSPIGGVNFFDSLFGMPPEDAIRLINWWPEVYGCSHRKGFKHWAGGMNGNVIGSLYTYHTRQGNSFLYAFAGVGATHEMYDVTTADDVYPPAERTPVVIGLSTSIWQATMFSNSAGTHKVLVSGQDNPIWLHQTAPPAVLYDRLTAGDGIVPGTISGVNPASFVDVTIHQKRLWFVEKDTTYGWYLDTEVVYGVANKFDFGPLFKRGGYLQSLATWTVDDGDGSDDLLVAFGSEGDVAVYKGINPDSDTGDWVLQGVYYAGAPIAGHRFHCKVAGDLKFLTQQGIVSMNTMLTSSRVTLPANVVETRKIQQFLAEQASLFGFLPGWDVKWIAALNMVLINIPGVTLEGDLQVALNVVNGQFTIFRGMDVACICPDYQDVFFYGNWDGHVIQGWTGNTDHVTIDDPKGVPITAIVQQAYNYFGTPANNKQVGLFRPNFLTDRSVVWKASIVYDFSFFEPVVSANPLQSPMPRWDAAIWDQARWAGGLHLQKEWASAAGYGFAGSLCMATKSDGSVVWPNTDFTVKSGGIL